MTAESYWKDLEVNSLNTGNGVLSRTTPWFFEVNEANMDKRDISRRQL